MGRYFLRRAAAIAVFFLVGLGLVEWATWDPVMGGFPWQELHDSAVPPQVWLWAPLPWQ